MYVVRFTYFNLGAGQVTFNLFGSIESDVATIESYNTCYKGSLFLARVFSP